MSASNILGNVDIFVLETACVAIDRLQGIEQMVNQDFERICDTNLMAAKNKYTSDFFKCCAELSLSPSARAKMGVIASGQQEKDKDPLLRVLKNKSS
jgi:phage terminase small subunit